MLPFTLHFSLLPQGKQPYIISAALDFPQQKLGLFASFKLA